LSAYILEDGHLFKVVIDILAIHDHLGEIGVPTLAKMRVTTLALAIWNIVVLSQAKVAPFEVTLTWEDAAPDGYERKVILTNGQLPGPPLYVDQGDDVEILVWNNMPFETTVHFHGGRHGSCYMHPIC
jgi:FtsP/CotA-like multicopper oxidase with cupredoxin domain